jgi:hypothetical protein
LQDKNRFLEHVTLRFKLPAGRNLVDHRVAHAAGTVLIGECRLAAAALLVAQLQR